MKIRIMSDVHNEFGVLKLWHTENEKDTTLILAGDIGLAEKQYTFIEFIEDAASRFKHIIYILGNHEFYQGKFLTAKDKLIEACAEFSNVYILEKESKVSGDVAFVCATLWTDFDKGNVITKQNAKLSMNDFSIIRHGSTEEPWKRKLTPNDVHADHNIAKEFIFTEIVKQKSDGKKVVVVSHHAPSFESVSPEYRSDDMNGAYASDLQQEILDTKPDLWIHGHMHATSDYKIGDTRVICNPRGYHKHEVNQNFDQMLVIDV